MAVLRSIFRRVLRWIVIPAVFFYGLMWVFHPDKYLVDRFCQQLESRTGIRVEYADVSMGLTGAIKLNRVTVRQASEQTPEKEKVGISLEERTYFTGESLSIRVALKPLLARRSCLLIEGNAYGGTFNATLEAPLRTNNTSMDIMAEWSSIDLAHLAVDHPGLQIQIGICQGEADLKADLTRTFGYTGPVKMVIGETQLKLPATVGSKVDLPQFTKITADLNLNHEEIMLDDIRFYAPDTIARIDGVIHQKIPVETSWMDLNLRLHLISESQPFNEDMYFPITLKGPINNPKVLFLGQDLRQNFPLENTP